MRFLIPCLLLALFPGAAPADELAGLARSLVDLRAEVEALTDELEAARRARDEGRRALAARKADLEGELQRERLRVRQIEEATNRKKAEAAAAREAEQALLPAFYAAEAQVRAHVEASLPFRREERLAEVTAVRRRLDEGLVTPANALARLWALVEDELRLTGDMGLFRQTVTLDGEERLADVVRLGMVGLYFRAGDEVGVLHREGDRWVAVALKDPEQRRTLDELFASFGKQIRVGYFRIPNLLPVEGSR